MEFALAMDNSPYPRRPIQFASINEARIAYEEFVQDCDNFGMGEPANVWLYYGEHKDEVECLNGVWLYPDYPDRIMKVNNRGNVKIIFA